MNPRDLDEHVIFFSINTEDEDKKRVIKSFSLEGFRQVVYEEKYILGVMVELRKAKDLKYEVIEENDFIYLYAAVDKEVLKELKEEF